MQITLTNRSFSTQLMAVITVGMMTLSLAAVTSPTGVKKPSATPLINMATALNQANGSIASGLTATNAAVFAKVAGTIILKIEQIRNDSTSLANLSAWLKQNAVAVKQRKVNDTDIHTAGVNLERLFGFVDSNRLLKHIFNDAIGKQGASIDSAAASGLSQALENVANGLREFLRLNMAIVQAQINGAPGPMLTPSQCAALTSEVNVAAFVGTALNIFGGPETPWAWFGDGLILGGLGLAMMMPVMGC